MQPTKLFLLSSFAFASALLPAQANVLVKVDQSAQHMTVSVDGEQRYSWPVATGRAGYATPNGSFRPNRMEAEHFSDEYDAAPMPHSIFFDEHGHAIHGSSEQLGRPASHGCVRLSPAHAAELFALIKQEGMAKTRVEIEGEPPTRTAREQVREQPAKTPRPRVTRQIDEDEAAGYGRARVRTYGGYAGQGYSAGQGYYGGQEYYGGQGYYNQPYAGSPYYYGR
jgi:DNA segregation ATPase FtsK/SpoIIIE-like protein